MKRIQLLLLAITYAISMAANAQSPKEKLHMESQIKSVIETFVKAGETRNITMYEDILHPDFRVIANRYPSADKTSIISAESYIGLIKKEIIGGTPYNITFKNIDIIDHSATVNVTLKAEHGGQNVTFLLILDHENKWKIISDFAVQTK